MSKESDPPHDVLVCVEPAKIDAIWPHVAVFIHTAYWTGIGDDTPESLKIRLDEGRALLWIVWDGKGILAAAVTEIVQVPARKLCMITACAGRELHRWRHFIANLEAYAKTQGCDVMRVHGRVGWKSVFPDYREPWVALEKGLL